MRILGLLALALVLAGVSGCAIGGPPRADETDRVAEIVALAIDFPRQDDATGYARAAAATRAGQDGRLAVVGVGEKRIVLRVHLEAVDNTDACFGHDEPAVTACYDVEVGVSGTRDPRPPDLPAWCGAGAPAPASAGDGDPGRRRRRGAVGAAAPVLGDGRGHGGRRTTRAPSAHRWCPRPGGATRPWTAADLGISVRGDDGCLLGSRVDGTALVWRPSWVQVQPGELSCDPATALRPAGDRSTALTRTWNRS